MTDRAFQIAVACSLVVHAIAALVLAGTNPTTRVVPPPAQPAAVRVRLAEAAKPAAPARPAVSAAPSRVERAVAAEPPISSARPQPTPAPQPDPQPAAQAAVAALDFEPSLSVATDSDGLPDEAEPADLPSAQASVEDDSNRLARYVEEVRRRIEARKRYPAMARKRAVEGRVVARVEIGADGRIATIAFEGGAPPLLRRATDEAIRAGEPYPAPPAGALTIELPVDYSLRDAS